MSISLYNPLFLHVPVLVCTYIHVHVFYIAPPPEIPTAPPPFVQSTHTTNKPIPPIPDPPMYLWPIFSPSIYSFEPL